MRPIEPLILSDPSGKPVAVQLNHADWLGRSRSDGRAGRSIPDAFIAATAHTLGATLLTNDDRTLRVGRSPRAPSRGEPPDA